MPPPVERSSQRPPAPSGPGTARRIRVFAPTFAEDRYCNAQQVNAREILRRLDPERFRCTLLSDGSGPVSAMSGPHMRARRRPARRRSPRILHELLFGGHDVVLYLSLGLPEAVFLETRRWTGLPRTSVLGSVEGDVAQFDEVPARLRARAERVIRRADRVYPITEYVARTLEARFGRTGPVIPVGVDREDFSPSTTPRRPGPLRVLAVGTVKAWKRPEYFIEAGKALPGAEFTWIGDGDSIEACRRDCPPNVKFPGAAGREDLVGILRDHDLLLHPSRMEGLPKVLLEAMACGLPVIAFDDYEPRFIGEGKAGFVVTSVEELHRALRDLAGNEELRREMGRNARAATAPFSWDRVAGLWQAEILSVAAPSARGE